VAIAEVADQVATGSGSGTVFADVVFPDDVTAGSLVTVKGAVWNDGGLTTINVAKQAGDATIGSVAVLQSTTGLSYAGGLVHEFIAYATVIGPGALTMRVTTNLATATNYFSISCDEFSGSNIALDVNGGETIGFDTAPTSTITTLTANALVIGVISTDTGLTSWSAGSGFTLIDSVTSAAIQPYAAEFRVVGAPGEYDVNFDYTAGGGEIDYSILSAAFKETAAGAFELDAESGSYALTGTSAGLVGSGATLTADTGSYALTGTAAVLGHSVPSDTGVYALTGMDATLRHGYSMAAATAAYAYTGRDVTLQFNGAPAAPTGIGGRSAKKILPPWFRH
jgi:hypothetical protein